jgi:hypothetical protein
MNNAIGTPTQMNGETAGARDTMCLEPQVFYFILLYFIFTILMSILRITTPTNRDDRRGREVDDGWARDVSQLKAVYIFFLFFLFTKYLFTNRTTMMTMGSRRHHTLSAATPAPAAGATSTAQHQQHNSSSNGGGSISRVLETQHLSSR